MTTTITLQLTESERDVLDWLVRFREMGSRSNALRQGFLDLAARAGISRGDVEAIVEDRKIHRPRRSRFSPRPEKKSKRNCQ